MIGVVTSAKGAVIKDIIDTTARRYPVDILLSPATVQGADAPKSLVNAIKLLQNENIDVINYTPNINLYIQRALSPAKISSMEIDEENKTAKVYLKPDEVSLAIGKGGYNVKLAGMLTGYEVEVYREIDEDLDDIYLDEFNDEIDQWVIDAFKAAGLDTAKEVLAISKEDLIKRTDLEEETIEDVIRILEAEFAND